MSLYKKSFFGRLPSGQHASLYEIKNNVGNTIKVTDWGATIVSIGVPDRKGERADVVLGFDKFAKYLWPHPFFGAICGRVAGRISGAKFSLNGKEYSLEANDGPNHLHGGKFGFDKVIWGSFYCEDQDCLVLSYCSPAMDQGYPGRLEVIVKYRWDDDNALHINYEITSNEDTIVNLTNHSYFNLAGEGDALGHRVAIYADDYAPTDEYMTLLGEKKPVEKDGNDFRNPAVLGDRIQNIFQQHGDTYFLREGRTEQPRLVATLEEPLSGRNLEVYTTEPALQFYSGASLDGTLVGKYEQSYQKHAGVCFEAQEYADAINAPHLGNCILKKNDVYRSKTIYKFGVSDGE